MRGDQRELDRDGAALIAHAASASTLWGPPTSGLDLVHAMALRGQATEK